MSFAMLAAIGIAFGIGFGFCVQRAGLCFAHGLGEIYIGKGKRIIRLFFVIFIITSIGFLLSGYVNPGAGGLKPIGQLRGFGFYNIISGIVFGAGIGLNGGCILGTLRQLGEGNLTFLIVLLSFIPGLLLITKVVNPMLEHGYNVQKVILPGLLGFPAVYITATLAVGATVGLVALRRKRQ